MQAPPDACRALFRLSDKLRFAWVGFDLNDGSSSGTFAIIQLMSRQECGTPDDPKVLSDFWDFDGLGRRTHRGTLFDKNGGVTRDFDRDKFFPIVVAILNGEFEYEDGSPLTERDLHTGKFIEAVRRWAEPIRERKQKADDRLDKDLYTKAHDIGVEFGEHMWHEFMQTGAPRSTTAHKHLEGYNEFHERMERKGEWYR